MGKEIRADYCESFCSVWLWMIGVREGRALSAQSLLLSFFILASSAAWLYTAVAGGPDLQVMHHLSLNAMGSGVVATCLLGHGGLRELARTAELYPDYPEPHLKEEYTRLRAAAFTSGIKRAGDVFTLVTVSLWANIVRKSLSGGLWSLPEGMLLPSTRLSPLAHLSETMFIVSAILVDILVLQLFLVLSLQLSLQIRVLSLALSTSLPPTPSPDLPLLVARCVRHHQSILRSVRLLKKFYEIVFHFIYFGIVWAIAFCRSLLLGDHIDFANLVPLLFLEVTYLFLFCYCADKIVESSEKLREAAYSTAWPSYPVPIKRSLLLIMTRTAKQPTIRLFMGGSLASQETITLVLNATLTYFMVSLLLK